MFVIDTALKVCYRSDVPVSYFLSTGFIALAATMPKTSDVQYEIELVIALKSGGADISLEAALEHAYGYGLGLDMTWREL